MDSKNKWSFGVFAVIRPESWGNLWDNNFWLVKHNYGQKKWSLPGGGLELGEEIDRGVIRETREETGFKIEVIDQPMAILSLKKSLGALILFEGYIVGGAKKPNRKEILNCRIFSFKDIVAMNTKGEIYPAQFKLAELAVSLKRKRNLWPTYAWPIKT
ncbi:MAG: hypothetical protein A3C71_02100 [Candidatus Yanofskybacteria bacterium RIFCSPHIGHO2_02_FULL_43_15c]|uniref:Nudix hydrolase domain-containing protein n=1 Tax=Candidatus Yanofskybacteria bacterium RIFCSPHIGHO2_02_FULL_43_15c TaxID=1802679 RepID=A0A1F8FIQ9_9BACT|nr:MAG: hypothetical protein A3C71_02100 [Candidatus Yanofskybacteria bacterium RIFCSPHIGHO2_02_FULL_43_15c]